MGNYCTVIFGNKHCNSIHGWLKMNEKISGGALVLYLCLPGQGFEILNCIIFLYFKFSIKKKKTNYHVIVDDFLPWGRILEINWIIFNYFFLSEHFFNVLVKYFFFSYSFRLEESWKKTLKFKFIQKTSKICICWFWLFSSFCTNFGQKPKKSLNRNQKFYVTRKKIYTRKQHYYVFKIWTKKIFKIQNE